MKKGKPKSDYTTWQQSYIEAFQLDKDLATILAENNLLGGRTLNRIDRTKLDLEKFKEAIVSINNKNNRINIYTIALLTVSEVQKSKGLEKEKKQNLNHNKELKRIKELLEEEPGNINEIVFRSKNKKWAFHSEILIKWLLGKVKSAYEGYDFQSILESLENNESNQLTRIRLIDKHQEERIIMSVPSHFETQPLMGRPKSEKVKTLKLVIRILNKYLDAKKLLMPKTGIKISDARRLFISNFLLATEAISIEDFQSNPKDYINSLLIR